MTTRKTTCRGSVMLWAGSLSKSPEIPEKAARHHKPLKQLDTNNLKHVGKDNTEIDHWIENQPCAVN